MTERGNELKTPQLDKKQKTNDAVNIKDENVLKKK